MAIPPEVESPGTCPSCGTRPASGQSFCAACGAPLAPANFRQIVRAELEALIKDRDAVEAKVFDTVVERIMKHVKWAGLLVGVALVMIVFAGFGEYRDIKAVSEQIDREVKPKVDAALRGAEEATGKVAQANASADELVREVQAKLQSAGSIDARVKEIDEKVRVAQSQIDAQQKKLTDTGELVKALFAGSRTEFFDDKPGARYLIREGAKDKAGKPMTFVYMLLTETPIPASLRLQFHVFSQPPGTYYVPARNLVLFAWDDPRQSLASHLIAISYVVDPTPKDKAFKALSVKDGVVYADGVAVPGPRLD